MKELIKFAQIWNKAVESNKVAKNSNISKEMSKLTENTETNPNLVLGQIDHENEKIGEVAVRIVNNKIKIKDSGLQKFVAEANGFYLLNFAQKPTVKESAVSKNNGGEF